MGKQALRRPSSAVSVMTGVTGLVGFCLTVWNLHGANLNPSDKSLLMLVGTVFPMLLWAVFVEKVWRSPSSGIDFSAPRDAREALGDSIIKLIGLWATFAAIAFTYWLLRWNFGGAGFYGDLLRVFFPFVVALSIPYVFLVDLYMKEPRDALWHFGRFVTGGHRDADKTEVAHHCRAWLVKAFFLAFMMSIVTPSVNNITGFDFTGFMKDPVRTAFFLIEFLFLIDICFGAIGYVMTFKVLDSHIRTANPTLSGWAAALICYPPFVVMGAGGMLNYHPGTQDWSVWLAGNNTLLWAWGLTAAFLTGFYAWATVAFGFRFSNLTDRGILTNGPYALMKHPAYVSKNLFWWVTTMPFLTTGPWYDGLRNAILMAGVNLIYYARAKTEEAHLRADPTYRAYEAWIAQNGLWPRLKRLASGT